MKKKGFSKVITILFFSVILVGCSGKSLEETKWLLRESIYKNDLNEVKSIILENPELVNTKYNYDIEHSPFDLTPNYVPTLIRELSTFPVLYS